MIRACLFLLCFALPAQAQVEWVIDRQPARLRLYLAAPLAVVPDLLGTDLALAAADVDPAVLAGAVSVAIAEDDPIPALPIKAVLHPMDDPIPFHAPWDASVAVDFGGATDIFDPTIPLILYARFDAMVVDGYAELTLAFAQANQRPVQITVRDFVRDGVHDRFEIDLAQSVSVTLADATANPTGTRITLIFAALFLVSLGYDFWRRRRSATEKIVTKP